MNRKKLNNIEIVDSPSHKEIFATHATLAKSLPFYKGGRENYSISLDAAVDVQIYFCLIFNQTEHPGWCVRGIDRRRNYDGTMKLWQKIFMPSSFVSAYISSQCHQKFFSNNHMEFIQRGLRVASYAGYLV